MNRQLLEKLFNELKHRNNLDYALTYVDDLGDCTSCVWGGIESSYGENSKGIFLKHWTTGMNKAEMPFEDYDTMYIGHSIDEAVGNDLYNIFSEYYTVAPRKYDKTKSYEIREKNIVFENEYCKVDIPKIDLKEEYYPSLFLNILKEGTFKNTEDVKNILKSSVDVYTELFKTRLDKILNEMTIEKNIEKTIDSNCHIVFKNERCVAYFKNDFEISVVDEYILDILKNISKMKKSKKSDIKKWTQNKIEELLKYYKWKIIYVTQDVIVIEKDN